MRAHGDSNDRKWKIAFIVSKFATYVDGENVKQLVSRKLLELFLTTK
jgi:hypothetical protein